MAEFYFDFKNEDLLKHQKVTLETVKEGPNFIKTWIKILSNTIENLKLVNYSLKHCVGYKINNNYQSEVLMITYLVIPVINSQMDTIIYYLGFIVAIPLESFMTEALLGISIRGVIQIFDFQTNLN